MATVMTTCVFNINKLSNTWCVSKANTLRARAVFAHQPQQGLEASSVGCWPPPWWLRSLLRRRAVLSLEWGGDRRHMRRSRRNADGEPPCELDGQMHNVKTPSGLAALGGSLHVIWRRQHLTCMSRHDHAKGLPLTLPSVERIVRYSRNESSQLNVGVLTSIISYLQVERCVIHLMLSKQKNQVKMLNRLPWKFYTLTSTITSKSVPNIGVTCLIDSFKFWGCACSWVGSMVWCPAFL